MTFAVSKIGLDSFPREYCGTISNVGEWIETLDVKRFMRRTEPDPLVSKAESLRLGDTMEVCFPGNWNTPKERYYLTKIASE